MSIAIARRIGAALNVKSETQIRSLNQALTEYVRLTAQSPVTAVPGSIDASQVVSGTFADARIAQSSVTQHEAAIDHDLLSNFVAAEHLDWAVTGAAQVHAGRLNNYGIYAEGTWTPIDSSAAALTFDGTTAGYYAQIGSLLLAFFRVGYPTTASGADSQIGGLPVNVANAAQLRSGFIGFSNAGIGAITLLPLNNTDDFRFYDFSAVRITNVQLSASAIFGCAAYLTSIPT